jgi:hypothetical protein
MRVFYLFILAVIVACYLQFRQWIDVKREKEFEMEVVREGEEHLGSWATKSGNTITFFRLHRNGNFTMKQVQSQHTDTLTTNGRYDIIDAGKGLSENYYPRLIAVGEKNDTFFNYFIAYTTPYDTKTEKVDKMVLNQNSVYDTVSQTFYRIKQ